MTPQKIEDFKTRLMVGRKPATVNRYLEAMRYAHPVPENLQKAIDILSDY